jgi:glycosyltransferase involved in cell wall biosynthesis
VTTIHDVSFFIGPEWFKPKDRLLLQRSIPSTIRRAAAVITVSDTSRREIERFIPAAERKTFVTPNACPPWVSPLPKDEAQQVVSRELGIEGPFLFTLGTRWPRKNMQLAIDAVEGLSADLDHKLIVTGKSGWGEQTAGKRTHFSGYLEDRLISALYSAATLYLAPSRHEGFGIPVLEAYRCGCPVLASTGGALPEVVGEAGEIEPSWDSADWTSHIESLLRDPSKLATMSESGRVRERLFTWEDTARATLSVYRKVLR